MGNKQTELNCINRVLQYEGKAKGITKQILSKLNAMERMQDESPDFVFLQQDDNHNITECIGVEHFEVDHISKINSQNGKFLSLGGGYRKGIDNVQKKWGEKAKNGIISAEELQQAAKEVFDLICKGYVNQSEVTYWTFIRAFEYSFKKHLANADKYRIKLNQKVKNAKLAFIVEVHSEFTNLYLCDSRGVKKNREGNIPIFEDMLKILESAQKKVDYIILEMRASSGIGDSRIIAFSTNQIRKQLNKQNIRIYKYAGEDCDFTNFESVCQNVDVSLDNLRIEDGQIKVEWNESFQTMDLDQRRAFIFNAFYKAWYARQHKMDFATTLSVLACVEIFTPYILDWQYGLEIKGIKTVVPILEQRKHQDYDARKKAFDEKWRKENSYYE